MIYVVPGLDVMWERGIRGTIFFALVALNRAIQSNSNQLFANVL